MLPNIVLCRSRDLTTWTPAIPSSFTFPHQELFSVTILKKCWLGESKFVIWIAQQSLRLIPKTTLCYSSGNQASSIMRFQKQTPLLLPLPLSAPLHRLDYIPAAFAVSAKAGIGSLLTCESSSSYYLSTVARMFSESGSQEPLTPLHINIWFGARVIIGWGLMQLWFWLRIWWEWRIQMSVRTKRQDD